MSSVTGECVGDLLGHKVGGLRVEVYLETLPLPFGAVAAATGSYSYPSRRRGSNMINAISLEEERGRTPNLSDESRRGGTQVRHRARTARSKVVSFCFVRR